MSLSPDAPRYVRDLDRRARRAEARIEALEAGVENLRAYLASPKFHGFENSRVQVEDVFLRLDEATGRSLDAEAEIR